MISADEALARLIDGNDRFVRGEARFPTIQKEILAGLAKGQRPYTTILGCSDSRVPPELMFDAGFGELFIVRVAGNVISPEVMGTLQYAGVHLQHAALHRARPRRLRGGAGGACGERSRRGRARPDRAAARQHPAGPRGARRWRNAGRADAAAVEANVRWSMHQLLDTDEGRARMEEGRYRLVGAVYQLTTGRVRFLE